MPAPIKRGTSGAGTYRLTPLGRRVAQAELARLSELVTLGRHAGLAPKRT